MRFPRRKFFQNFCPPKPCWPVMKHAPRFVPLVLRFIYGQARPEIRNEELHMLRQFKDCRLVLAPNHPDKADPAVVTLVAAEAGLDRRYILANRTQFDGWRGLKGHLMQSQGAYSIARGTVDRASFRCTRDLLSDLSEANQILIYPEGGNYSRTDSVFPFLPGVFGLVTKAQEELTATQKKRSKGDDGEKEPEPSPIFIVPMALRYVADDLRLDSKIDYSLRDLERQVGLEHPAEVELFDRIVILSERMLTLAEQHEGLPSVPSSSPFERLERMQLWLLEKVESHLGFYDSEPHKIAQVRLSLPERTRKAIEAFLRISDEDYVPETAYEQIMLQRDIAGAETLRRELARLQNWIDVKPGYLHDQIAKNRIVDTIMRFELEIHGRIKLRVRRRCVVRIGRPINVSHYTNAVQGTKKEERNQKVLSLTQTVEDSVRSMLLEMSEVENMCPLTLNLSA